MLKVATNLLQIVGFNKQNQNISILRILDLQNLWYCFMLIMLHRIKG